jgi:hypothetical protein
MVFYSDKQYKFVKFERSKNLEAKYDAILENKQNKRRVRVPFGNRSYEQWRDTTGLKLYSHLDHNDQRRRASYRARHGAQGYQNRKYSPAYFSWNFLW